MPRSPIEHMIDAVVRCTKCGAQGVASCGCWEPQQAEILYRQMLDALVDDYAADICEEFAKKFPDFWQSLSTNKTTRLYRYFAGKLLMFIADYEKRLA